MKHIPHQSNIASAIGLTITSLSFFELISVVIGIVAALTVIIVNIVGISKSRAEKSKFKKEEKLAELEAKVAEEQLKQLKARTQ